MRFGNGYKINSVFDEQLSRMPVTCGTYNSMPATAAAVTYPSPSQQYIAPAQQQQMTPSQQAMPALPSGFPTGGTATPLLPAQGGMPAVPVGEQMPTTVQSTLYTPGFLKTQIGRRMRIEFLIGTGALIDRTGTLISVGASYILIQLIDSDDIMMCDIYSIKFVTIFL